MNIIIKRAKYYVIRPSPADPEKIEAIPFDHKFAMQSFINGCSNPEECVPVRRLPTKIEVRCK